MSKDGKTLEDICIEVVDPEWAQMILRLPDDHIPYDKDYEKWRSITDNRWRWE